jgi:hypothetical protein
MAMLNNQRVTLSIGETPMFAIRETPGLMMFKIWNPKVGVSDC